MQLFFDFANYETIICQNRLFFVVLADYLLRIRSIRIIRGSYDSHLHACRREQPLSLPDEQLSVTQYFLRRICRINRREGQRIVPVVERGYHAVAPFGVRQLQRVAAVFG